MYLREEVRFKQEKLAQIKYSLLKYYQRFRAYYTAHSESRAGFISLAR